MKLKPKNYELIFTQEEINTLEAGFFNVISHYNNKELQFAKASIEAVEKAEPFLFELYKKISEAKQ